MFVFRCIKFNGIVSHSFYTCYSLSSYSFTGLWAQPSGCSVDWLNACDEAGTSKAGFLVKNPSGRSMTLTFSMGMTGKSSTRGLCVSPNASLVSFASVNKDVEKEEGRELTMPKHNIFILNAILAVHPFLNTLGVLALVRELASCEELTVSVPSNPDRLCAKDCAANAKRLLSC